MKKMIWTIAINKSHKRTKTEIKIRNTTTGFNKTRTTKVNKTDRRAKPPVVLFVPFVSSLARIRVHFYRICLFSLFSFLALIRFHFYRLYLFSLFCTPSYKKKLEYRHGVTFQAPPTFNCVTKLDNNNTIWIFITHTVWNMSFIEYTYYTYSTPLYIDLLSTTMTSFIPGYSLKPFTK